MEDRVFGDHGACAIDVFPDRPHRRGNPRNMGCEFLFIPASVIGISPRHPKNSSSLQAFSRIDLADVLVMANLRGCEEIAIPVTASGTSSSILLKTAFCF